jgi:trehalose 6-phosphate phosphatase
MYVQVYETLTAKMEAIPGAMVENNKFCLSVHFRCVDEEVTYRKCKYTHWIA